MNKSILLIIFLSISVYGWANEITTLKDGRKVLLKDNGTWSFVESSTEKPKASYRNISLIDLKLDITSLTGEKIKVKGVAQLVGEMLMLKSEMMDMNPIFLDFKQLPRDERKFILTSCSIGCKLTAYGVVGSVMFQHGVIITKIE